MKQSMARRIGLRRPKSDELDELEADVERLEDADPVLLHAAQEALAEARAKLRRVPWVDPVDLRYRRYTQVPKPSARAVMFCLMDVSGSMSETMKDLAKRFFLLLYVFLERRYRKVEIVFIRHTETAEEVDEQTFFTDPRTGSTVVSTALVEMLRIQRARYPVRQLEHLCGAGVGRRQFRRRQPACRRFAGERHPAAGAALRLYRGRALGRRHPRRDRFVARL